MLSQTLRSRKGSELLEAIKGMHQCSQLRGHKPNHQTLGNDISTALID